MLKTVFRKIYRLLFPAERMNFPTGVTGAERSVSIDPSALLMPSGNGKIIFGGNNYIGRQVELGTEGRIEIGFGTTIQDRCILLGDVELGKYCTFAPNVYISSGRHYYAFKPHLYLRDQDKLVHSDKTLSVQHSKPVVIGDDVWIGINSVIMSGVKIGRGAVIGSNSVVTKDVAPFTVVAGQPAKEIKKRLDFEPRSVINFNVDEDLVHFYEGVNVDMESFTVDRRSGGLSAFENFTLHLKEGKEVRLNVKKNIPSDARLVYNDQSVALSNEYTTITFTMKKGVFHHFYVETPSTDEKLVLIKEVTVIS